MPTSHLAISKLLKEYAFQSLSDYGLISNSILPGKLDNLFLSVQCRMIGELNRILATCLRHSEGYMLRLYFSKSNNDVEVAKQQRVVLYMPVHRPKYPTAQRTLWLLLSRVRGWLPHISSTWKVSVLKKEFITKISRCQSHEPSFHSKTWPKFG